MKCGTKSHKELRPVEDCLKTRQPARPPPSLTESAENAPISPESFGCRHPLSLKAVFLIWGRKRFLPGFKVLQHLFYPSWQGPNQEWLRSFRFGFGKTGPRLLFRLPALAMQEGEELIPSVNLSSWCLGPDSNRHGANPEGF